MLDLRTSGYFLIVAGLLMLTRMIPIFMNLPDGFTTFPPPTTEDMAILAAHNTAGYHYSHLMGLFALPLMWMGFLSHSQRYIDKGMVLRATTGMVSLTVAVSLFGVALLVDGFLVPIASAEFIEPTLISKDTALYFAEFSHSFAMTFFIPSSVFFAIGLGVLASPIAHGHIHGKWFGFIGIFLGNVGVVSYIFDWRLNGMELSAGVMMAFFLWTFLLGFSCLRAAKMESEPKQLGTE